MSKKALFFLSMIVLMSGIMPAFAEVTEIQLDRKTYPKGDSINVKGSVTSDASGLVTIVLRDPTDKFVLLSQAIIQANNSFEKIIPIKEKFQVLGSYNATAFVLNMTDGKTKSFDIVNTVDNEPIISNQDIIPNTPDFESEITESETIQTQFESTPIIKQPIETKPDIKNHVEIINQNESNVADFVDENKELQYYLDRYYNEPVYKSWFDRNYPNLTIEEAIGYTVPELNEVQQNSDILGTEIIPQAQAKSIVSSTPDSENNSEAAHLGLALGGLAVLFGAVYGVKRKIDDNSKHISINKDIIRQKFFSPILDSNPIGIIQVRLAKGEISIEEYEKLRLKMGKNSR